MSRLIRPILLLAFVLAVPIVPFLLTGEHLEQLLANWLNETANKTTIFWSVVAVLSTDVLLPTPSSVVSTFAGWQLGVTGGTLASWLGMTAGAVIGFWLARAVGRPLAKRLVERDDLDRLRFLSARFGPKTIVLCRALPVLAEASVLFVGAMGLSWPRFFLPTALANLGIALAYSILGSYSADQNVLVWAFAGSVALPLIGTALVRRRLGSSIVEAAGDGRRQTVKPDQANNVRKSRRIGLMLVTGLIAALAAVGAWLWFSIHHVPEFYEQAVATDRDELEKSNKQLLRRTAALRNELKRIGTWQARFTDDEINGWLAVDVPKNHPDLLPPQLEEPRVSISPDAVLAGARYTGGVASVVSLEVSAHLPEENVIAVRVRKLRVGDLPWSLSRIIDEVTASARDLGVGVQQSQIDGDPLLIFSLSDYWETEGRQIALVGLEFEDGAVVIRGRTK